MVNTSTLGSIPIIGSIGLVLGFNTFYCPKEKLVIELDGEVHDNIQTERKDNKRDLKLKSYGITVLRFENKMVFEQQDMVLNAIKREFK